MNQSTGYPHLSKAPITEALVDIQVILPTAVTIESLARLHDLIRSDFPHSKTRHKWAGSIDLKEGEKPGVSATEFGVDGYLFSASDSLQVVQFRLDGFTFSRLKPYQTWLELRDEAKRLWKVYRENTRPESIVRVAVRYINLIQLPVGAILEEYFVNPPKPPRGLSENIQSFLDRVVVQDPKTGIVAIVTKMSDPPPGTVQLPAWLDLDIHKVVSGALEEEELWGLLENLAAIKNDVFFNLVTRKTVEMYL